MSVSPSRMEKGSNCPYLQFIMSTMSEIVRAGILQRVFCDMLLFVIKIFSAAFASLTFLWSVT